MIQKGRIMKTSSVLNKSWN